MLIAKDGRAGETSSPPHNFADSLAKSHAQADAPWWGIVYRNAFPDFVSMVCVRKDGWAQRGGIDRVITLESGKTITVDEKVRDGDWPDILWEYWSNHGKRVRGWCAKALACDYIAYAFIPTQVCYLLPALQIRRAWRMYGREWVGKGETGTDGFCIVDARNDGYVTRSVAVPIEVTLSAIRDALIARWENPS